MARTKSTLLLWMALFAVTTWISTLALENACFELPLVIISPTTTRLPTASCIQKPLPSPNCMKEPVDAVIEVVDHSDNSPNCMLDARTNAYLASVHYRGQSSLNFPKHQLGVTLSQPNELLGFPSDSEFVLNGPWIDGSLLRNHLAHWLFRQTTRYSPRTRHFVLFIRDKVDPTDFTPVYKGIYLALEKISYGPSRVALAPLDSTCASPSELSGGWAWQINPLDFGVYSPNLVRDKYETAFGSGERPVLMHPAREVLTQHMRDFFVDPNTSPLSKLYAYLYENATSHPELLDQHIDIGSFVDYFLHSEMSQNTDAYRRSTYFFKDRDQPINAGPVWDFNLAYGKGANQEAWLYTPFALWKRLVCNYQFAALVQQRWRGLRASVWSDASIQNFLQESVSSIHRQLEKCANWTSADIYCANVRVGGGTFDENVQALEAAVLNRAKWMDANVGRLYMATNASACVPVGSEPPQFNCAKNASDGGCLSDPEAYIRALEFPAVRFPSNATQCTGNGTLETPSIDPCWLSVGVNVVQSALTTFCSGYGFCEPGPGAMCQCVQGHQPPTCAVGAAPGNPPPTIGQQGSVTVLAATPLEQKSFTVPGYISWGCIFAMTCVVCGAMVLYFRKTSDRDANVWQKKEEVGHTIVTTNYGTYAKTQEMAK